MTKKYCDHCGKELAYEDYRRVDVEYTGYGYTKNRATVDLCPECLEKAGFKLPESRKIDHKSVQERTWEFLQLIAECLKEGE